MIELNIISTLQFVFAHISVELYLFNLNGSSNPMSIPGLVC
jgi:hypothetical protein